MIASSQELPMVKVQPIKHSDKNRPRSIWGLKTVCVLQKCLYLYIQTHKITNADLFLLLWGYSKAVVLSVLSRGMKPSTRKKSHTGLFQKTSNLALTRKQSYTDGAARQSTPVQSRRSSAPLISTGATSATL